MHLQKKTKKQKSKTISHPWLHFQIIGFGREKKINVSTSWSLWIHKLKGSICTYPPVLSVCGVCRCYHLTMQIDPIPYTHLSNRMYKSLCWASKQCRALTNSKGSFALLSPPPGVHLHHWKEGPISSTKWQENRAGERKDIQTEYNKPLFQTHTDIHTLKQLKTVSEEKRTEP